MTVSTEVAVQTYIGNGVATNFAWANMKVLDTDHIRVTRIVIATDVGSVVSSADYTVNGVGTNAGSIDYLYLGVALPSTHSLLVERIVPYTQEMDIANQGAFLPEVIEQQLDVMVMQIQQLKAAVADLVAGGTLISLTGAVAGPAVAVNGNFALFDGASGTLLKDSGVDAADFAAAAHTHSFASLTGIPSVFGEEILSPAQIVANQNDYSPTGLAAANILRLNSNAVNRQITGLATGAADRRMLITNVGSFDITLRHENAGSSAANRFSFSDSKALILGPKKSIELYYDTVSSLWRSRTAINPVNRVILPASVTNNNAVANTLEDITDLSFGVIAGIRYKFKFFISYTAAAATTGSRWSVNGPAITSLAYRSEYTLTATSQTNNENAAAYDVPAASNASSLTVGNIAIIEGVLEASADGTLIGRFASEVTVSAIIALLNVSYVEYEAISA